MPTQPPTHAQRIIFACTYNRIRSPMAAALMSALYPNHTSITSCGVEIKDSIGDGFTIAVMQEVGIDLTHHASRDITSLAIHPSDTIICLSETSYETICRMRSNLPEACQIDYWSVYHPDLLAESRHRRLAGYRAVREELRARLIKHFGRPLTNLAKPIK